MRTVRQLVEEIVDIIDLGVDSEVRQGLVSKLMADMDHYQKADLIMQDVPRDTLGKDEYKNAVLAILGYYNEKTGPVFDLVAVKHALDI
jgi:hypothetical protein